MKNQSRTSLVVGAAIPLGLFFALLAFSLTGKVSTTTSAQTQPTSTTENGLRTVTLDTPTARVTVKLPDDIRTGDTISGTLVSEPKGSTEDERAKNRAVLRTRILRLMLTRARKPDEAPTVRPVTIAVPLSGGDTSTVQTSPGQGNVTRIEFNAVAPTDANRSSEAELGSAVIPLDVNVTQGAGPLADPTSVPKFSVPPLGQTGRPVVVTGPFDGKGSTTDVKLTAPPKPIIKISTFEPDIDLPVIAESPRKAIIEFPQDVTGQTRITVTDGRTQTSAPFRNVGVNLSAPKTRLLKGEKTTMTIQITGLQNLILPVPLTLQSTGVITMTGGSYQQLMIQPSQVGRDGIYTTTRDITGVQTGGWGATATVMTSRFNVCLQDDADPLKYISINSFTGVYAFTANATTTSGTISSGMVQCINMNMAPLSTTMTAYAANGVCGGPTTVKVKHVSTNVNYTITDGNPADSTCTVP